MWKNIVEPNRPQMTIWRTHIPWRAPNATNAHSEYVILIAVPLQQWLCERCSMVHYTYEYIVWLVIFPVVSKLTLGSLHASYAVCSECFILTSKAARARDWSHLHQVPRSSICGALSPLPAWSFNLWSYVLVSLKELLGWNSYIYPLLYAGSEITGKSDFKSHIVMSFD